MPKGELVFKIKADFLKALAHPARLAIIEHLKTGESSVGDMVKRLQLEQSGLSKHLSLLRQAGILASRQERVTVYYFVRDREIYRVLRPIAEILRRRLSESAAVLAHLGKVA